jgi:hypothetical protein
MRQPGIIAFVQEKLSSEDGIEQLTSEVQMLSLQGGAFDFLADEPDLYDDYVQSKDRSDASPKM